MLHEKMSKESLSTSEHLSVGMTTTDIGEHQTTGVCTTPPPPSSSSELLFYFQCAVLFIGAVGAAANALVLYAMIASKQHKKQLLIFSQNVFDLCSCLVLVVLYTLRLCNIHLTGTLGYWLCMIILSESLLWASINASQINLLGPYA